MQYYRGNTNYYGGVSRRGKTPQRPSNPRFSKFLLTSTFLKIFLVCLVVGLVAGFGFLFWISRDLPTPGKLANSDMRDSTKILDRNGEVLYSIFKDYNRIYVPLDSIPETMRQATIATEDKDFYENKGFSPWAYMRVAKDALIHQRVTGGSTITQQLVKNALLSPERSATRKLKELILAVQVDKRYTKDEVLEMYLNNVPFGGTAVGVEAAANLYFDKPAKELNLAQSAFLAGLPQSPTYYSPFSGQDKAYLGRSQQVLERMREEGYITREQEEKAYKDIEKFKFTQKNDALKAPHFVMYVRQKIADQFGEAAVENGNLIVKTTLDYKIQKEAEKIVQEEIKKLKTYDVSNGSAIVLDPKSGAILAMVGSADYFDADNDGNFNASTSLRQPGSSLKPVMYATAFEKGYTASTLLMDVKTELPGGEGKAYNPVNYDGKYRGPVQVRFALGNSLNIPAVKLLAKVGIKPVMEQAYNMGIENWEPTQANVDNVGLSLVLGGREASLLQIATAYSVFANEGIKHDPFSILEVHDSKGKELYKKEDDDEGDKVLSPETAFLISHILYDKNARKDAFGVSSALDVPGHTVAVKTGTTDQKRDNWTIGYTPSYVVGVWVGNNDNREMNPRIASGITGASPIWNRIMRAVLKNKSDEEFKVPENVTSVEIDALGGGTPVDGQEKRSEYFVKGTEPTAKASIYKQIKISKEKQDKLANSDEISHNDYDTREYIVFDEEDPVSTDGKNRWDEGIKAWVAEKYKDDSRYKPPTETSDRKY